MGPRLITGGEYALGVEGLRAGGDQYPSERGRGADAGGEAGDEGAGIDGRGAGLPDGARKGVEEVLGVRQPGEDVPYGRGATGVPIVPVGRGAGAPTRPPG